MVKIANVFFVCCVLVINRNTAGSPCDYVLCKTKSDQAEDTGYYASGSAISSQFLLPDGSVVTNSKETSLSSDGIKSTFHELKKEADHFVHTGSSNQQAFNTIPAIPIPKIPIPYPPISSIPFPYPSTYLSSGSQGGGQQSSFSQGGSQQSGFSQTQVQSSNGAVQHQYQQIPKVTSYTKEHELRKKVVTTSKGTSDYPAATGGQYLYAQQNSIDTNANSNSGLPLRFPAEGTNVNYQDGSATYNKLAVGAPVVSSQSSFQAYDSSSSQGSVAGGNNNQVQPSSFHTGAIDLSGGYNQVGQGEGIHEFISHGIPTKNTQPFEQHYQPSSPNTVPVYNAVGGSANTKYNQENYHSKANEYEGAYKPPVVNVIQYGSEKNSSHAHNVANLGLPTAHISKVVVHVNPQTVSSSQSFHKQESASSQISGGGSSSSSGSQTVPVVPTSIGSSVDGGLYSSMGAVYELPAPLSQDSVKSHDKQTFSSSQTYGFQSPVIVQGVPHNIPLDQQAASYSNSGNNYYSNGYVNGVAVPIPFPTGPQAAQQFSSSSNSANEYYSSNGGSSIPVPSGGGFYYNSDGSSSSNLNKVQGASASIYDSNGALNSNAETLCGGCYGSSSLSSPVAPVKSSYGISTSFSSHSSTVNGKKTESREASVAVNDNGKLDSYHTKS